MRCAIHISAPRGNSAASQGAPRRAGNGDRAMANAMRLSPLNPSPDSMRTATALTQMLLAGMTSRSCRLSRPRGKIRISCPPLELSRPAPEIRSAGACPRRRRMLEINPAFRVSRLSDQVPATPPTILLDMRKACGAPDYRNSSRRPVRFWKPPSSTIKGAQGSAVSRDRTPRPR